MIRLADVLKDLIDNNPLLQSGLKHRLLNLTQLSKFIRPQIEARAKKEASEAAILMALSRLQQSFGGIPKTEPDKKSRASSSADIHVDNISINAQLSALSFHNTIEVNRGINSLYNRVHRKAGFITITHGMQEIRVILERVSLPLVKECVPEKPLMSHQHLASLGVSFKKNYLETPGFFYLMFQQLYFQNINVVEIASTANELLIYVHENDVRLAFDTLYNRFLLGRRGATT
jgi:hypothetical protein